jgi:hypothetical protein
MPLHIAESTLLLWRWLVPGFPSMPGQHRSREGRQGLEHQGEPESRGEWYGSGGQVTSCLDLSAIIGANMDMG